MTHMSKAEPSVRDPDDLDLASVAWPGPLRLSPEGDEVVWIREHREFIDRMLLRHGALLLRGCNVETIPRFREIAVALCGDLLAYTYRSTPRTTLGSSVYSATDYRAHGTIPLHNENSYQREWPMRLAFCCFERASEGGQTSLASTARVTARIPRGFKDKVDALGVTYIRNYIDGIDLDWRTTFQTDSRSEVEEFCRARRIECDWSGAHLRTAQVSQGMARHPVGRQKLWFNQAHLFHASSLGEKDRESLLDVFGEMGLPRNALFGDGTPFDEADLRSVRNAYEQESLDFEWEVGDVLLIDNMLVAHGRRPFKGDRRIAVAMGDLLPRLSASDVS